MPSWCAARASIGAPTRHQLQRRGAAGEPQQPLGAAKAGDQAELISGWPTLAVSAAMRRWQHIASFQPATERKTIEHRDHRLRIRSTATHHALPAQGEIASLHGVSVFISEMSAPATNAFGRRLSAPRPGHPAQWRRNRRQRAARPALPALRAFSLSVG